MKVLITGICGFVGSRIAFHLLDSFSELSLVGIDNFVRKGSETNRDRLIAQGVEVRHGDLRCSSDLDSLPSVDWVIDAAALPSVLAGIDGQSSSRQLTEHNLVGTINLLEYCRRHQGGLILLSTSRVYSIEKLSKLPLRVQNDAFVLDSVVESIAGVSPEGIDESCSTAAPVSLYGATKIASEVLAAEYGLAYQFPLWINRCGVIAGGGQFGRPEQGIFAYWIHSHAQRKPLKYLGFAGSGHQVRDCLHVSDLARLVDVQLRTDSLGDRAQTIHVSGGSQAAISLKQLTAWCDQRFGKHQVAADPTPRTYDLPWVVLDHALAQRDWGWRPEITLEQTLEEIAQHAEANPHWLEVSR